MTSLLLPLIPAAPLAAAALIAVVRPTSDRAGRWAVVAAAFATIAATLLLVRVAAAGRVSFVLGDDRAIAGLTGDLVGAVLATLTAAVSLVVLSFCRRALDGDPRAARCLGLASLLTGGTTTVALAATGTGLALGWIVTSVSLVALLGHRRGWRPAAHAVRRTARAFLIGDLALLAAVAVALTTIGDLDLRSVAADATLLGGEQVTIAETVRLDVIQIVAVLLVVAGIARSALVPLHRWLPSTIAAPTPVSALLHAGVVNGAGVLVIRTAPITGASTVAMAVLFATGVVTVVLATSVMLVRSDVKGALAWSTAGQMGFMTVQLAVGAFAAALFHLVGHAMYKAALFLGAGGAITAHDRARHRPHATSTFSLPARAAIAGLVPAAGLWIAFATIDPHVTPAGGVLIAVFGWCSAASLTHGWLQAAQRRPATAVVAVAGGGLSPIAYVAGIALFESAVADVVPFTVPGAVATPWLVATIAVVAAVAVALRWAPGAAATAVRRTVYGALLGFSAPPLAAPRPTVGLADDGVHATAWSTPVPVLDRPLP